jgi:hypothetical protein
VNDLSQLLSNLPPVVGNVLRQVQTGNHAAVPDAQANAAFSHVASQLTPEEFQQVAADAYQRMTPDQRSEVAEYMRTQPQQQGGAASTLPSSATAAANPGALAAATAQVHSEGAGALGQLFAPGGTFSSPIAKLALLGITAMAAQRLTGRR